MSRVGVDIGGTHTDIVVVADGTVRLHKVPSNNADPAEAVLRGLEELGIRLSEAEIFAHGTTVATNAVIQRNGASTGLITTSGFRDVLQIRRTTRGELYDFRWDPPAELVPRRLRREAKERISAEGEVLVAADEEEVVRTATELWEDGVRSLAIAFVNSYVNATHEERCREAIAAALPDLPVYLSAELLPEWREFERTSTAVVGAYVGPVLTAYLRRLETALGAGGYRYDLMVMRSNGGLATAASAIANPVSTLMSGPAAGVIAQVTLAAEAGIGDLVGMDVGGTSTDVSVVLDGEPQMRDEFDLEFGTVVRFPMIDIHSIGAGGGTVAWLDEGGMLHAGPRSAGAQPGPVSYMRGGTEPTLTDAQLALGRLNPAGLLGGGMAISKPAAEDAIAALGGRCGLSGEEMAAGVVTLTVSNVASAIREITVERGVDPRRLTLVAYGGGGPTIACEVAAELEMAGVLVPPHPGLTSATGLLLTDIRHDVVRTYLRRDDECAWEEVAAAFEELLAEGSARLQGEAIAPERRGFEISADLRYHGQTHELTVPLGKRYEEGTHASLAARLREAHLARYGYAPEGDEAVELVTLRVAATGAMSRPRFEPVVGEAEPRPGGTRSLYVSGGWRESPVYERSSLGAGSRIEGPALVEQLDTTTFLPEGWIGATDANGCLLLRPASGPMSEVGGDEARDLGALATETAQARWREADLRSTEELVRGMNEEDRGVPAAVAAAADSIAAAVDAVAAALENGGRLLYVGAGTSGRMGALDAVECPPTFDTDPGLVSAVLAGGASAFVSAAEGAEDDFEAGAAAVEANGVGRGDVVLGISASGRTPFVLGGVSAARARGATTVGLACNGRSELAAAVQHPIEIETGPEFLAGSTRLKAGTAQKLVLNMISTIVMIKLGKTFGNLMVDVRATNEKLRQRAVRIVAEATGAAPEEARSALASTEGDVKAAIVVLLAGVDPEEAQRRLRASGGRVRGALERVGG